MSIYHFFSTRPLPRATLALFRAKGATFTGAHNGTPAYLSIAEHFEHVGVERFNGLVMAREDLFLDGAQVQRVRHLLVVMAVPKKIRKENVSSNLLTKATKTHNQTLKDFMPQMGSGSYLFRDGRFNSGAASVWLDESAVEGADEKF